MKPCAEDEAIAYRITTEDIDERCLATLLLGSP